MSDEDRREADRRARDRRASGRALAPVDPPATEEAAPMAAGTRKSTPADPAFSAQLMGQEGQRRGLKGGPPVLDAARSGYLKAQHSGPAERRPKPGTVTKSDV
ncbi:hypothetical protein [Brevundimonas sp.]|jgi:hypothetical protein|uniref:hypothetical protein n=1 Tax=Brevundimonas sp. TaxID=1871086 RepID=UPI002E157F41|nr:hypothetical protein [Brevundimonas sp.]